jgi:hypothetical protein
MNEGDRQLFIGGAQEPVADARLSRLVGEDGSIAFVEGFEGFLIGVVLEAREELRRRHAELVFDRSARIGELAIDVEPQRHGVLAQGVEESVEAASQTLTLARRCLLVALDRLERRPHIR